MGDWSFSLALYQMDADRNIFHILQLITQRIDLILGDIVDQHHDGKMRPQPRRLGFPHTASHLRHVLCQVADNANAIRCDGMNDQFLGLVVVCGKESMGCSLCSRVSRETTARRRCEKRGIYGILLDW